VLVLLLAVALMGCATEKNVYVVKADDASFQDVARTVYPSLSAEEVAAELEKANPKAAEDGLQPGEKLVIPEMKSAAGEPVEPKQCDRAKVYN
jgi:hypothetical protein